LFGTLVTFLVVVPPWGFYKKAPVKWLKAQRELQGVGIVVDGKKVN
jgi:signal peptidase complex subunit 1